MDSVELPSTWLTDSQAMVVASLAATFVVAFFATVLCFANDALSGHKFSRELSSFFALGTILKKELLERRAHGKRALLGKITLSAMFVSFLLTPVLSYWLFVSLDSELLFNSTEPSKVHSVDKVKKILDQSDRYNIYNLYCDIETTWCGQLGYQLVPMVEFYPYNLSDVPISEYMRSLSSFSHLGIDSYSNLNNPFTMYAYASNYTVLPRMYSRSVLYTFVDYQNLTDLSNLMSSSYDGMCRVVPERDTIEAEKNYTTLYPEVIANNPLLQTLGGASSTYTTAAGFFSLTNLTESALLLNVSQDNNTSSVRAVSTQHRVSRELLVIYDEGADYNATISDIIEKLKSDHNESDFQVSVTKFARSDGLLENRKILSNSDKNELFSKNITLIDYESIYLVNFASSVDSFHILQVGNGSVIHEYHHAEVTMSEPLSLTGNIITEMFQICGNDTSVCLVNVGYIGNVFKSDFNSLDSITKIFAVLGKTPMFKQDYVVYYKGLALIIVASVLGGLTLILNVLYPNFLELLNNFDTTDPVSAYHDYVDNSKEKSRSLFALRGYDTSYNRINDLEL